MHLQTKGMVNAAGLMMLNFAGTKVGFFAIWAAVVHTFAAAYPRAAVLSCTLGWWSGTCRACSNSKLANHTDPSLTLGPFCAPFSIRRSLWKSGTWRASSNSKLPGDTHSCSLLVLTAHPQ